MHSLVRCGSRRTDPLGRLNSRLGLAVGTLVFRRAELSFYAPFVAEGGERRAREGSSGIRVDDVGHSVSFHPSPEERDGAGGGGVITQASSKYLENRSTMMIPVFPSKS
jgi:hypothetical protein